DIAASNHAPAAAFTALFALPLIGTRTEIRPEVFSYFFATVFLWMLWNFQKGRVPAKWLFILLPLTEILWVNTHIYFILGPALTGAFFLETMIAAFTGGRDLWPQLRPRSAAERDSGDKLKMRQAGLILLLVAAAALVNPFFIRGAFYPFFIFENYGYRLFENQSVVFIQRLLKYPPLFYFKLAFGLLIISWAGLLVTMLIKRTIKIAAFPWARLIITAAISALGWLAVRNLALFGYFLVPLTAANLADGWNLMTKTDETAALTGRDKRKKRGQAAFLQQKSSLSPFFNRYGGFAFAAALLLTGYGLVKANPAYFSGRRAKLGIGLEPGNEKTAEFFIKTGAQGPIMNNYDIGGYLIFYLYPGHKVFVDNRPEAYPASFFTQTYVAMQENEEEWKKQDASYRFNAVIFSYQDLTPWGQNFIIKRTFDPEWAPVFADKNNLILLKRNGPSQSIIDTYELPKEMFSVRKLK
ncbi:MAG: hypothetical protein HY747_03380, partial [Elusimicrobia bacterium]|nr:hypothetical protein [Elusimicrobiota bacterium]